MKRSVRPTQLTGSSTPGAPRRAAGASWDSLRSAPVAGSDPLKVLSRIKLALLDDHAGEKRGYDPYDTSGNHSRDVWASKRKRA